MECDLRERTDTSPRASVDRTVLPGRVSAQTRFFVCERGRKAGSWSAICASGQTPVNGFSAGADEELVGTAERAGPEETGTG
jgi:hypothetical protein